MNFITESKPRNEEIEDRWKNRKNQNPQKFRATPRNIGCELQGPVQGWIFLELRTVFKTNPTPFQIVFVRTGEIMITLGLSIDTAVAWGKVIRVNPAFCFEQLPGAGKNIFNQFHHFSAISYLPLFSSFALFFYFCFFFYLLLFMFDIFLGTRVRTVVQIAMTVDYVL